MRLKQLDALRAIAVLLVMGRHLTWNPVWYRIGWTGVDLFFVLSGFLVSGLLFREYKTSGHIRVLRFLGRRAFKIYPAYYLLLILTVASRWAFGPPLKWRFAWPDFVFVQSYRVGLWGHLWSLAVEEHFYLLLPAALYLMLRRDTGRGEAFRGVPLLCGLVAMACLGMRIVYALRGAGFDHYKITAPSHLRLDSLAFGVLLSYLWEFRPRVIDAAFRYGGPALLAVSALLLLPDLLLEFDRPFIYTFGLTLSYLGYGGILLYFLKRVNANGRIIRALAPLGTYSYTIYLCHLPVAFWSIGHFLSPASLRWGRDATFATYLVVSCGAGVLLAKLVERPGLALRERLLPTNAPSGASQEASAATAPEEVCAAAIPSGL